MKLENQLFMLLLGGGTFLLSLLFVWVFSQFAPFGGLIDIPNNRSSHQVATPRGGGVVFVMLWLTSVTVIYRFGNLTFKEWCLLFPTGLCLSFLGFWDDHGHLSARSRLTVQFVTGSICVFLLGGVSSLQIFGPMPFHLGIFGSLLAAIGIVWSVNLYNFMDGIDGIASIEALFIFGVGGLLFCLAGHSKIALVPWAMVMGVSGFLVWNWPKAKIFMGDAGSYCLGFLVAILSLLGDQKYDIPLGIWVILYGLFWFDTTVTLIRRMLLKKHWATAHRDHAYQRLHLAGFSHSQVLVGVILVNTMLAAIALWTFFHQEWMTSSLVVSLIFLSTVYISVERLKPLSREEEETA